MEFEWDEAKRRSNVLKHKVDFVDVQDAFDDPQRQAWLDGRHDYGEARFSLLA